MERETKNIKLKNGDVVKIIAFLTWGEKEEIQNVYASGAEINATGLSGYKVEVVAKAKEKLLSLAVKEITKKDGEVVQFSMDYINNLSVEDGDALFEAVDEMTKKK